MERTGSEVLWSDALVQPCARVGGLRGKSLGAFLRVAWHQTSAVSEEQPRCLMSPTEAMCRVVREAPPSLRGAPSGGWWYTGLGRAVKLSSTAVLPPLTAGSARICGPREAKGRVTSPLRAIKHASLPQRETVLLLFPVGHYSRHSF